MGGEHRYPQAVVRTGHDVSDCRAVDLVTGFGEIWSAQPYDETLTIEPGETVEVFEIRGATAYVHPIPRLDP